MRLTPIRKKKLTIWLIGIAACCMVIFLALQNIGVVAQTVSWALGLLTPLILGVAFALILNVPMRFFELQLWKKSKKPLLQKLRRPVAYLISLLLISGIVVGIVWLVIPELVEAIELIIRGVLEFLDTLSAVDEATIREWPLGNLLLSVDWEQLLETAQKWLQEQSGAIVNMAFGTLESVFNAIFNFFIAIVFSADILFNKKKLKAQLSRLIHAWLPEKVGNWSIHAASIANTNFRNFISGQTMQALILGALCMIGMLILQIPYAPMVGVLVGVTAFIPVIGGFIGIVVGGLVVLTADPIKAVVFVIFLVVLQQLEVNLIYPRMMGSRVNLPGMWVLAVAIVGGSVGGIVGMLLSVPIASTAYTLVKEATLKRERKKLIEKHQQTEKTEEQQKLQAELELVESELSESLQMQPSEPLEE